MTHTADNDAPLIDALADVLAEHSRCRLAGRLAYDCGIVVPEPPTLAMFQQHQAIAATRVVGLTRPIPPGEGSEAKGDLDELLRLYDEQPDNNITVLYEEEV